MKLFIISFLSAFIVNVQQNHEVQALENHKLLVEIDNIHNTDGKLIRVAISKKSDFLKDVNPYKYVVVEARGSKISETFVLPPGEYAISIYHDLNSNDKLDKNFFGAPSEPYGFSRNYKPVFRAPRFDEVKIVLHGDRKTHISLLQP